MICVERGDFTTSPLFSSHEQVLEGAVGYPFIIYAKVLVEGKEQIVAGPVFSYYEFKQRMSDRLTDEQWQQMLRSGKEPLLPSWTNSFIAKQE